MPELDFESTFQQLTGNSPFPWQRALYQQFMRGEIPEACNLPTGLGKTSVIALWLISLANSAPVPRRLVYVVNRRTVVDQTTVEVEKYRAADCPGLPSFAISTLRGQFADNREWSADPSRPAVVCGTVDMIGSRLLFSGYGIGMKSRPLHAGFLGQDSLLVHDEAHLEPAFQRLIEAIRAEQLRCSDLRPLKIMELSATSRNVGSAFSLSAEDKGHPVVARRLGAVKKLFLHALKDTKKLADSLASKAKEFEHSCRGVLVFASTVEDVIKVRDKLPKGRVAVLTGTLRGKERDEFVQSSPFQRFLPGGQNDQQTTYLVCTSAGEVGVNISADHLICDLTTYESMAQRLGRVNRFGNRTDTQVHVFHPEVFEAGEYHQRRARTLKLLSSLKGDASPESLASLNSEERVAAFTPQPTVLPINEVLFDFWAMTSIRAELPGRPSVAPYLHGLPNDWQPPETSVAWRQEVELLTGTLLDDYSPAELLEEYPLKPHELLRDNTRRVFETLKQLNADPATPIWVVSQFNDVEVTTLFEVRERGKEGIENLTVVLPPSAGGLSEGMLDSASSGETVPSLDIADTSERTRIWDEAPIPEGFHVFLTLVFPGEDEEAAGSQWHWCRRSNEDELSAQKPVLWTVHVDDVRRKVREFLDGLALPTNLRQAVEDAAAYHDHGKRRKCFQSLLGNYSQNIWLAKSGKRGPRFIETYRHEFGSLLDAEKKLAGEERDLILHLIAAHHGRGRPHFPVEEVFDPEHPQAFADEMGWEVPRRFEALQRKFGRWGLAYLESILRAADWAASKAPSSFVESAS